MFVGRERPVSTAISHFVLEVIPQYVMAERLRNVLQSSFSAFRLSVF
jgi:hypothetical protein